MFADRRQTVDEHWFATTYPTDQPGQTLSSTVNVGLGFVLPIITSLLVGVQ
jgi:hypothetical protein